MHRWSPALLLLAAAVPVPACEDFSCCNSCGRSYSLVDDADATVAWIGNAGEGGNECEIGEVPRSFDDTLYTVTVEVVTPAEGVGSTPEVHTRGAVEGRQPTCDDGSEPQPTAALANAAQGDVLCIAAEITAIEMCTQKACAGSSL